MSPVSALSIRSLREPLSFGIGTNGNGLSDTGAANCVGMGGLGLGGGHGCLESPYALVADGYVHLNVDGSEIGVNATSHEDLFWAMKGAGHDFAIVTSSRVRIHPWPASLWHYHSYTWTGDKLETVTMAPRISTALILHRRPYLWW
ncbi:hypothetical protein F4818DRAFT_440579 [Hypoxylon cercidicola]|nr:hypothetical protein F4818DRAFT_440579 [Hypoxylon cercidicola]